MPIHDWTRVDAGVFHGFHLSWIAQIKQSLNTAILPPDFYADAEQHIDEKIADILTLRVGPSSASPSAPSVSSLSLLDTPAMATVQRSSNRRPRPKPKQRHIAIRHVSGHRVVAMLEIVSPGNKDRRLHVQSFVEKAEFAINEGIHFGVIDLFPPTTSAPNSLPCEVWRRFERERMTLPEGQPLSLGSIAALARPKGYFEFLAVGQELPRLPLFITETQHVILPLAETYATTFAGSPSYLRELLSQTATA